MARCGLVVRRAAALNTPLRAVAAFVGPQCDEDHLNAEYAGKTLACLTSMWGVRDRVREAGLLKPLVHSIHPLAGLNQRSKASDARIRPSLQRISP